MAMVGRNYVLAICGPNHSAMGPCLYDARLVTISGDRMLFEGVERVGDEANREAESHMQEWAVHVTLKLPASFGAVHGHSNV
ncbi:hypothetical protein [Massilia sp. TS11]|uniref:hypothetical protein n=1 Tax=Massilia sp. TS11 TaxID=2908003 RepID=UPI001EDB74D6|nr:hypothetical protein [Massilia sp. TS11]MCG2585529.1 hypothetical protein [Massilia sp. TS11]